MFNHLDGFSTMGALLFHLPGLDASCSPSLIGARVYLLQSDSNISIAYEEMHRTNTTSSTLIFDALTGLYCSTPLRAVHAHCAYHISVGQRHPHFSELDMLDIRNTIVIMNPARPLAHARYDCGCSAANHKKIFTYQYQHLAGVTLWLCSISRVAEVYA
jgi:hypothetical protein